MLDSQSLLFYGDVPFINPLLHGGQKEGVFYACGDGRFEDLDVVAFTVGPAAAGAASASNPLQPNHQPFSQRLLSLALLMVLHHAAAQATALLQTTDKASGAPTFGSPSTRRSSRSGARASSSAGRWSLARSSRWSPHLPPAGECRWLPTTGSMHTSAACTSVLVSNPRHERGQRRRGSDAAQPNTHSTSSHHSACSSPHSRQDACVGHRRARVLRRAHLRLAHGLAGEAVRRRARHFGPPRRQRGACALLSVPAVPEALYDVHA